MMLPKTILIVWVDEPGDEADEREFRREARACAAYWQLRGARVVTRAIDGARSYGERMAAARSGMLDALIELQRDEPGRQFDTLIYFGHGLRSGLPGIGWRRDDVRGIVRTVLREILSPQEAAIVLYSCSTGGEDRTGPRSFGRLLASAMATQGFAGGWVWTHTVAGHTTRNRAIRVFPVTAWPPDPAPLLVLPSDPEWGPFRTWLRQGSNRWDLPWMLPSEVRESVRALALSRMTNA